MLTTFKLALIDWHWLRCSKIREREREREREKKVAYLLLLLLLPLSDAKSALINSSKLSNQTQRKGIVFKRHKERRKKIKTEKRRKIKRICFRQNSGNKIQYTDVRLSTMELFGRKR